MGLLGYMTTWDNLRQTLIITLALISNAINILVTQITPKESLKSADYMFDHLHPD